MGQLLEQLGCTVRDRAPVEADPTGRATAAGGSPSTCRRSPATRRRTSLVRRLRASIAVLGPAGRPVPPGQRRAARRRRDRLARASTCTWPGLRELGADGARRARPGRGRGRPAGSRGDAVAGLPLGRRDREPADGRGARRGTTRASTTPRGSRRSSTCAEMLVAMGARIEGIVPSTLTVDGRRPARPGRARDGPDRIVAGTWAFAAAIAGGDVTVRGRRARHLDLVLDKLADGGAERRGRPDGGFTVCGRPAGCAPSTW